MKIRKTQYNKITASLNNSAAIDKNGEVFVWGLAKTGILGENTSTNQYSPYCMNIKGMDSQFKAIHVTMGLNHIAVIVSYAILDLIDLDSIPPQSIKEIIDAHKVVMERDHINVLKLFEKKLTQQRYIDRQKMEDFFRAKKFPLEKDPTNQNQKNGFSSSQVEEFFDFFCLKDPNQFNLVEYYYQTNKSKIKRTKLLVWGMSDSGRLGLSQKILNVAQSKQRTKKKGKIDLNDEKESSESEEEEENDDDYQNVDQNDINMNPSKPNIRAFVNKQVNDDFKHDIKHVACGHHHTLVVTEKGRIYYFGMGTQGQLGNENFVNVDNPTKLRIKPKRKFIQVACGSCHSMALTDNGQIFSWGKNSRGQLGQGHKNDQLKPTLIIIEIQANSISCGDQHSAFISDDKELYTWGNGQYFRLGHGVQTDELVPKKVVVLEDVYVTHVSCGMTHTLAITNEGFVYAWGDGMSGKLGVSDNNKSLNLPTRVGMNDTKFRKKVYYQVSAGGLHSLSLTDMGILYSWGSSKSGVLGIGFQKDNKEYYSTPQKIRSVAKIQSKNPKQIQFFSIKRFIKEQRQIEEQKVRNIKNDESNQSQIVAINNDSSMSFMKGSNFVEQDDIEIPFTSQVPIFRMIFRYIALDVNLESSKNNQKKMAERVIFAVASANNSFFLSDIGQVHACGSPKKGILIMDPKNEKLILKKKKQVIESWAFNNHQPGTMLTQNENSSVGQSKSNFRSSMNKSLARSNTTSQQQGKTPNNKKAQDAEQNMNLIFDYTFQIPYFKNKIIYLSCNYTHAIAISHKGVAYSWGCNKYYQLGLGYHCKYNYIPCKIQGALETKRIVMSTTSDKFSALLTDKGEVWTFGTSDSGVCGQEEKNYYVVSEPKMINDIPPMIYLTSGPQGMMAISAEKRQIYAWGNNLYGQLGIQITNNDMNVNQFGQNLDSSSHNSNDEINLEDQNKKITKNQIIYTPTRLKIENDRKITNIGMGMFHSVAIDDQGHLYSCGLKKFSGIADSLSKEGLSGFDDTLTYMQHEKIRNYSFQQVSVSEYHTLALTNCEQNGLTNRVFGWGLCNLGNLCLEDQKEIIDAVKQMRYQMKDLDTNEPLKDMFVLPIDLTELGKFNTKPDDPNDLQMFSENIIYISAGLMHNIAINENGKCFSWGSTQNGRLGIDTKNQNIQKDQFFITTPTIVSVLYDENRDDQEVEGQYGSTIEPSQKKSIRSKKNSMADTATKSRLKSTLGQNSIFQSSAQIQQQTQQQEDEGQENDYVEIDDLELDILEQTSFGSDSSKDVFSSDNEKQEDQIQQDDEQQNSIDQDLMDNEDDYSDVEVEEEEIGNIFSKLPQTHKRQDNVQKKIWKEEDHCMEENLIKEDKELEDFAKTIIYKSLKLVFENEKNLQQAESKIESIIQVQIKNQAKKKGLEILDKVYFNIPSFIVKNIQLYETIFSLLYHHPCYILNLLKTNSLSVFHLKTLINQLFKNPIDFGPSNFTLITLTIETFQHEYEQGSIHINDIKNIQQSSLFWHLYTLLFERQKTTVDYFKKLVSFTIGKDICHQIFVIARMQLRKDNPKYLSNLLDYLQGTANEIKFKAGLLLKTIQPLMTRIAGDFQAYTAANQQIFTEELLYVHSKIVNFAKTHTLKKQAEQIREERLQQIKEQGLDTSMEDTQFLDRQIQKKLQYLELSLDNKLNNFIFLISYGYIIYIIENFERFEIEIDTTYLPILKSPTNIKIIAELLERFITKSSIKINNKCFDEINQFLLERKDIKKEVKKKVTDQFDIPKRQNPINPGTKSVLQEDISDNSSEKSNNDQDSDENSNQQGNTYYEDPMDENQQEDQNLDALIDRIQKSLHLDTDFELSVSQIQSLVEQSSNLKTHYLQVPLSIIFQIHNIYTVNHANSDLFVISQHKLDQANIKQKLNKFDPIYVIFQYLQFEPVNIEDFQTEILDRKVNLKLSDDLTYFSYSILRSVSFYKCIDCGAIIPIQYLPSNQQMMIKQIQTNQREQWKCSKGHMNSLKEYKCQEFSCDEFISEEAIKNFRLIKYYNLNKEYGVNYYTKDKKSPTLADETMIEAEQPEELTKKQILTLMYKILQECDPLKEGENEYEFFDKFRNKPKLKENPELKNRVNQLMETLEIGFQPDYADVMDEKSSNNNQNNNQDQLNNPIDMDDSFNAQEDELKKKQIFWNDKFKYYKDMLGKIIDNRKVHNETQRVVRKQLHHADALLLENIAKIQDLVQKKQKTLQILRSSLIPDGIKNNYLANQNQQQQKRDVQPPNMDKYLVKGPMSPQQSSQNILRKPDAFAYYTTQKLFKKNVLVSISFKSIQILEIEKSIKFYIFCNSEGSFEIMIVYAKEEFVDNFTSYNKHLYPNRMLLHKIYIPVSQYREMKRLEYTKTNVTFSTDTIQVTFDMNKLMHMLQKKEGKIFDLM